MARKIKTIPAAQDPRRKPNGQAVKGIRPAKGRQKGTPNKRTALLRDAILQAAALVGQDGQGKQGLLGYLKMLAIKERVVYARMLERVLPLQVHVADNSKPQYTPAEAIERLRERGIPVPHSLMALAGPSGLAAVAHALNDESGRGSETDALDNRVFGDENYEHELNGEDEE